MSANERGNLEISRKSRKRTRNPSTHKANVRKQKVQKGEIKSKNKKIDKNFCSQVSCRCKKNVLNV